MNQTFGIERSFDTRGVALLEEHLHRSHQFGLNGACLGFVAFELRVNHTAEALGERVGSHRDNAQSALVHNVESQRVVARQHKEILGFLAQDGTNLLHITTRLFDTDDVGQLRQTKGSFGSDIHTRTRRHVVENNGQGRSLCNCLIVLIKTFLRGFVVVGSNAQYSVETTKVETHNRVDNLFGAVATDTDNKGYTVVVQSLDVACDCLAFVLYDGGSFGSCSECHDVVNTSVDNRVHYAAECAEINTSVGIKRRDKCNADTFIIKIAHSFLLVCLGFRYAKIVFYLKQTTLNGIFFKKFNILL